MFGKLIENFSMQINVKSNADGSMRQKLISFSQQHFRKLYNASQYVFKLALIIPWTPYDARLMTNDHPQKLTKVIHHSKSHFWHIEYKPLKYESNMGIHHQINLPFNIFESVYTYLVYPYCLA